MLLTISIVNWNTTSLLKALLVSISNNAPKFEHEVIVVDNASSDFNLVEMHNEFPAVNFIANSTNDGYAHGNNQVMEQSCGDYMLLLNPDTEVTEGALECMVNFMQEHPEAAATGGKMVRPDGSVDRSVRSFPYPGPIAYEFTGLARLFPKNRRLSAYRMDYFNYDSVIEVDQPMGSCLILSRLAIKTIGIMDEQFPIFFNEVDWLYRAKQAGFKVFFLPNAVVIHHGAGSTKQVPKQVMSLESHKSLLKFYEKHFKHTLSPISYWLTVGSIKSSRLLMKIGV